MVSSFDKVKAYIIIIKYNVSSLSKINVRLSQDKNIIIINKPYLGLNARLS